MITITHVQGDVVEVMILHKGAPLARPVIVCTGHHIPGERTTARSAARAELSRIVRIVSNRDIGARGFSPVRAHACTDIGLELSEGELDDEVRHEGAGVNQIAALGDLGAIELQVEVSGEAVVEHVFFKGEPDSFLSEYISRLDAAISTHVMAEVGFNDVAIGERL